MRWASKLALARYAVLTIPIGPIPYLNNRFRLVSAKDEAVIGKSTLHRREKRISLPALQRIFCPLYQQQPRTVRLEEQFPTVSCSKDARIFAGVVYFGWIAERLRRRIGFLLARRIN